MRRVAVVGLLVWGAIGCVPWDEAWTAWDGGSVPDAGAVSDGGAPGGDAGVADAGHDAGSDAGTADAGPVSDAGSDGGADAGQDAGTDAGLTPVEDAGQAPSFSGISPSAVLADGGVSVNINGTHFEPGDVALINGVPCVSTTYFNANALGCVVPATTGAEISEVAYGLRRVGSTGTQHQYASAGGFSYLGHPVLWLDTMDPGSMTVRLDGGHRYVSAWNDKSSAHNDVTQPLDYFQPELVTRAGGVDVLEFSSSNACTNPGAPYPCGELHYLERLSPQLPRDAAPRTAFMLARVIYRPGDSSFPSALEPLSWGDADWCNEYHRFGMGFGALSADGGYATVGADFNWAGTATVDGGVPPGAWGLMRYTYDGGLPSGSDFVLNGGGLSSVSVDPHGDMTMPLQTGGNGTGPTCWGRAGSDFSPLALEIGRPGQSYFGDNGFNGQLAAVLVYPRVLSTNEAAVVEGWMRRTYQAP